MKSLSEIARDNARGKITTIEITFEDLPRITVEVYRGEWSADGRKFPNEECAHRFIDRLMREARNAR